MPERWRTLLAIALLAAFFTLGAAWTAASHAVDATPAAAPNPSVSPGFAADSTPLDSVLAMQASAASPFQMVAHEPVTNALGVALTAPIHATFDGDVDATTVTSRTFVVHGSLGGLAAGSLDYDAPSRTLTWDADRAFHAGELLRVSATDGICSTSADPLSPCGWQFTAGEVYSRCVGRFADSGAALPGVCSHWWHGYAHSDRPVAWGDYDGDGDLDILLTGNLGTKGASRLYRNDGSGVFTEIEAGLTAVDRSSVAWGDYDNDGDLDIVLAGAWGGEGPPISTVYRNDGGGTFTDIGADLIGVMCGSVAWGDCDNDGDLDLLLTGQDFKGESHSRVYRNDGGGAFTDIQAGLTCVDYSSAAWGDYDNDGDLDILLTGSLTSKVYRNDGEATPAFTDIGAGLTGVTKGSVAWGDYDNDGDLDILLAGYAGDATGAISRVYRNDGGSFTDIEAALTPTYQGSAAWGDCDNDGDLDILLTGSGTSMVYRNDGQSFTDVGADLPALYLSSGAWGDYDNDGDLDMLLTGALDLSMHYGPVSWVYHNDDCAPFQLVAHEPVTNTLGVALTAPIRATFDGDVDATTVTSRTFVVHGNLGGLSAGSLDYDAPSRTLTLHADRPFHAGELLRVSATDGICSTSADPLSPCGWQFTAGEVYSRCVGRFADTGAGLATISPSKLAWGDYDNDGDLDILLVDSGPCKVYRNDGGTAAPVFTDIGARLGEYVMSAAWGDYDNDGDLDIVFAGWYGSGICRNDGDGSFTDIGAHLAGVILGSVAWGDYDNDGDLDLLLTGQDFIGERHSLVYRNDGGGAFTDIGASLPGVMYSSVAWGDYDDDGDLDILLTGKAGSVDLSRIYRNNGAGVFTNIGAALSGVSNGAVAWGDYDNDGDLDILLSGKVYRNDGRGVFTDIAAGLTGVTSSSVAWGDYDNDGDLDILLAGWDGSASVSKVYRNDATLGFTDVGFGLTGVRYGSVAWADYDKDGDLDILLSGESSDGPVSRLYRNDDCVLLVDHEPDAQQVGVALTATIRATFNDDLDESTITNDSFVVNGNLRGLAPGALSYDAGTRSLTLQPQRAFHPGEWLQVSASAGLLGVDGTPLTPFAWQFTAGPVAERCAPGFVDISAAVSLHGVLNGSAAWGDYDNDGDLDILLTGNAGPFDSPSPVSKVYRNDGGPAVPAFTDVGADLAPVHYGSGAWGDYDNDSDLDILLTGLSSSYLSKVYRNDGGTATPVFTDIGAGLIGVRYSSAAWGDYDSDGDLDILLTGQRQSKRVSKVYRNDGATFSEIEAGLSGVDWGAVAWGDYDNDGDLDILLTGQGRVSEVYRNDGLDTFRNIGADLIPVWESSVAWGDYDNDGDLDILLTGNAGGSVEPNPVSIVYRNDGDGIFTDIGAGLAGVRRSSAAWGDYDNDGDLDILLTGNAGYSGGLNPVSIVYRNDGDGIFTDIGASLTGVGFSSVAWGDCDNDGDLDILLTGWDGSGPVSKVYRNVDCGSLHIIAHDPGMHEQVVSPSAQAAATFFGELDATTLTGDTFAVHGSMGGRVGGTLAYDGQSRSLTLTAGRALHANEVLRVSASSGISSTSGNALAPYGWQFTAGLVNSRRVRGFADTEANLTGVRQGSLAWGDYDQDGDLDILLTGSVVGGDCLSKVYRNDNPFGFTDTNAGLAGVCRNSSSAWGDYDNDGDLDILLTGRSSSGPVSLVYRNDGASGFTGIAAGLTGVEQGAAAWGDCDNDTDLDILLTGYDSSHSPISKLYRNTGHPASPAFTEVGAGLTGVGNSSVAWGDYSNDGWLDILLTGESASGPVCKVYRNNGTDSPVFTDVGAGLIGVSGGSAAWGDYDRDGKLDIVLSGWDGSSAVSKVYRNDRPSGFTDVGVGLTGVYSGSVAWGDYDNDGYLDILVTGRADSGPVCQVYRNEGPFGFRNTGAGLPGVWDHSMAAWADYDNDGDLDILLAGDASVAGGDPVSRVYRNDDCPQLVAHSPAAHAVGVAPFTAITASFDSGIEAGTVTSHTFAVHGDLGGPISGTLAYHEPSRTLSLSPDRPFHSGEVLRVTASSAISSSSGDPLTPYGWQFTAGPVTDRCFAGFTNVGISLRGGADIAVAWGDYDNDGDLDALLTGSDFRRFTKLYRNEGGQGFTEIDAGLPGVTLGSQAWGDYDNDGDLDILLAGDAGGSPVTRVYRNDGGGAFTDIEAGLTGVCSEWPPYMPDKRHGGPFVAWGDYDNDGDLDILLSGDAGTFDNVSKVYRNDGASGFTEIPAGLPAVGGGSVAWGDYDLDGDLDILLTGSRVAKVYRNEGVVGFIDAGAGLTGVTGSSAVWGDYDNDGDLDILLTGISASGPVSKVYRNDGGGAFTEIEAGLTGVYDGSCAWGDYDNDGDLDILLAGRPHCDDYPVCPSMSAVYRNDGGAFAETSASFLGGYAAWADYDNDGDLDILASGWVSGAIGRLSRLYRNDDCPKLRLIAHQPAKHKVGVAPSALIQATFDGDLDATTPASDTFVVHGNLGGLITGTFAYEDASRSLTLDPERDFHSGEVLRVSATAGILSASSEPLGPFGWQFTAGPVTDRTFAGFTDVGAALDGVASSAVAWGDYDNDNDLDILLAGDSSDGPISRLYRNDGTAFTSAGVTLTGVMSGSVAWGDCDNDGDLDILLTGSGISKVYRNDGSAFSDIAAHLWGMHSGCAAWGDYDNDGDLDILLTGDSPYDGGSKVYRNDGSGAFVDIRAELNGVIDSSAAWGDYDNDGDLDVLVTGYRWLPSRVTVCEVYRNDRGSFQLAAELAGVRYGSAAWGDYDNDGDLDIVLTGDGDSGPLSLIYRNDARTFIVIDPDLICVKEGSAVWGDYDNDGDLDILLSGESDGGPVSRVYRNDSGSFTDIEASLAGVRTSSAAWGDYDNDGDLDILLTGQDLDGNRLSKVYRNESRPALGGVAPSSGSGPQGITTFFTTTWSDPDGWQDLKRCWFHFGADASIAGNVTLMYNARKNKLWILNDGATAWIGGCEPGSMDIVQNSRARVHCRLTTAEGSEDTVTVKWAIEFLRGYRGEKKTGLKCRDRSGATAMGEWKGTWTIQ